MVKSSCRPGKLLVEKFGEKNKPTVAAYDVKGIVIADQVELNDGSCVDANKNPVFLDFERLLLMLGTQVP